MKKLQKLFGSWSIWKKRISASLASIVVFVTVYSLVLPAITLDQDTANQDEGIGEEVFDDYGEDDFRPEDPEPGDVETDAIEEGALETSLWPVTLEWPDVRTREALKKAAETAAEIEKIDYTVTASFDEEAELPADVTFQAVEIAKDEDQYGDYYEWALDAVRKEVGEEAQISYARFFDIAFLDGGYEVEPEDSVSIVIEYDDEKELKAEESEDISIVHFDWEDPENPVFIENVEITETDGHVESICFESGTFSVYGVVKTSVGEMAEETAEEGEQNSFSHSLMGGESIMLSELLETACPDHEELQIGNVIDVAAGDTVSESKASGNEDFFQISYDVETGDYEITASPEQGSIEGKEGAVTVLYGDESAAVFEIDVAGVAEVDAGLAKISTADGIYLPDSAEGSVEELAAEDISPSAESIADTGGNETVSRVFDISLNLTPEEQAAYEGGFQVSLTLPEEVTGRDFRLYHIHDGITEELDIVKTGSSPDENGLQTVSGIQFVTESFSEFILQYTVDFHYEVNGKMYEFSIPGGGFVSLEHLVEVLGISELGTQSNSGDENETKNGEIEGGNGENTADSDVYNGAEETGVDENGANASNYEESINLNNVEVSEATKKFVADVANVEFSSPELVWVGKVDETSTVGGLKEANGLEVQYSAELTEEQIAEINGSTVEAGDWALISVLPFMSEESLTVTMKNGDQFVVKVTDAQISTHVITADGEDYIITVTYGPEAGIRDGATLEAEEILEGTEQYESYMSQAMEALHGNADSDVEEFMHYKTAYARFFDISIILGGSEIEPKAPVSVTIAYAGKVMTDSQDMNVVHFADTGIELLHAETGVDTRQTSVYFEQSSFSVTGTIVNYTDIDDGEYYIVHYDTWAQRWYALAYDGTYVDVTDNYNDASASISGYDENGKNIAWVVSESVNGYTIKAKDGTNYITLSNGNVVGTNSTVLNLHSGTTGSRNTRITIDDTYTHTDWGVTGYSGWWPTYGFITYDRTYPKYALGWSDHFVANSSTSYDYWGYTNYYDASSTNVQFAKLSEDSEVVDTTWPNNTYNEQQLQTWLEQALNDEPLKEVDKIGYVYDYDNRIYEIDFSAKSGVLAIANDLSLAFVTDVSNSMLFPSSLTPVTSSDFTNSNNTFSGDITMNTTDLNKLKHSNGEVYYSIGEKNGSSTVYAIWYDRYWHAMDASYYARWKALGSGSYDSSRDFNIGSRGKLHNNDSTSTTYTIYKANSSYAQGIASGNLYDMSQGDMGNRLYYLEYSVNNAISDMKSISATYPLGGVYVGLETFAKTVQKKQTYLQIGGYNSTNMDAANTAYNANYNTLYDMITDIKGADGTDQMAALNQVTSLGTPSAGTDKYVVLITDGAPNVSGVNPSTVAAAAKTLKQAGYTVITVGLSVKDVTVAPELLWRAASFVDKDWEENHTDSLDKTKTKYYYYADDGDDLTWILREIVRTIMKQATVSTTITDEIDKLFYPVSKDGEPIESGEWINLAGEKVSADASDAAGQVTYNNTTDTWTVTWTDQPSSWAGWHGTVFVKAKEDFMGGNNISTNVEASFVPERYYAEGAQGTKSAEFSESVKTANTVNPDTPYVNVDELHMTQNNTEWTVYLGTEVDPEEQIEKLWDAIKINTVVDTNGLNENYTMKTKTDMYYDSPFPGGAEDTQSPESGVETVPLSHYISSDILTNATNGLLKQLQDGSAESSVTSVPVSYVPYGQGEVGSFIVTLTKTVNAEAKSTAPASHTTESVSDYDVDSSAFTPVESYTLTVTYAPKSGSERKTLLIDQGIIEQNDDSYQHHGGHGMAKEATESTSENTHVINVFAKKLKLLKVDQAQNTITGDEAEFILYKKATTDELADSSVEKKPLTGLTGSYVAAQTLTTENGVITTNLLQLLKGTENYDEPYYLVETKAPAGYIMLTEPLKVSIDLTDHNTWGRFSAVTTYENGVTYYTFDANTCEYVEVSITSQADIANSAVTVYKFMPYASSQTKPDPYVLSDWLQEATIKVTALNGTDSNSAIRVIPAGQHGIIYDHTNDTTDASVQYKIINDAGVELPSTGGPGTNMLYLFGIMLTGLAGAGLVMKRRRRNVA